MSQWGERGVGSSKASSDDTGVVIGKIMSTQILTTIPMKLVIVSLTTTSTTTSFDQSKDQSTGIPTTECVGGLSSALVKITSNNDPKDKRKSIEFVMYNEEKKRLQAIKLEKHKQINSILRQRANDPPGLNKGYPNKHRCYETIEIEVLGKNDEFRKTPKKSYDTENSDFMQLHFLINHNLFTSPQLKIAENFNDKKNSRS
ncbi:unnamed protein product [Lactuca virosa]|uniref:Uncharacterized protein n=1 Tax=Lactuca virosa TaxID=75947 RepID=A0AAU9MQE9_9ASTR|nr:unnamed protein product [Lactuca virosa]